MIWVFGDSWVEGAELWDTTLGAMPSDLASIVDERNRHYRENNRWTSVLSELTGRPVRNFGRSGCSNTDIVEIAAFEMTSSSPEAVIVCWTTQWRLSSHKPAWFGQNPPWGIVHRQAEYSEEDENEAFLEFYKQVMTIEGIFKTIPVLHVNAFNKNKSYFPLAVKFYDQTLLSLATDCGVAEVETPEFDHHIQFQDHPCLKPHGHPSELGHRNIAGSISGYFAKQ